MNSFIFECFEWGLLDEVLNFYLLFKGMRYVCMDSLFDENLVLIMKDSNITHWRRNSEKVWLKKKLFNKSKFLITAG